jgi:hypothetical protein
LVDWCPDLFTKDENGVVEPIQPCRWTVQGIQVELSTSLVDLWKSLCCPDHFLYIVLSTTS